VVCARPTHQRRPSRAFRPTTADAEMGGAQISGSGKNRIMIDEPKNDDLMSSDFRIADREALESACQPGRLACSNGSRSECPMGCSCRTFVEEQSLLFSVRLACRRVRRCTDREQPRRKIVRRRQIIRTSRPHSRKWRVVGCSLPSKWSGWSVRTRPKGPKTKSAGTSGARDVFLKRSPRFD